jgi:hypothetical protein
MTRTCSLRPGDLGFKPAKSVAASSKTQREQCSRCIERGAARQGDAQKQQAHFTLSRRQVELAPTTGRGGRLHPQSGTSEIPVSFALSIQPSIATPIKRRRVAAEPAEHRTMGKRAPLVQYRTSVSARVSRESARHHCQTLAQFAHLRSPIIGWGAGPLAGVVTREILGIHPPLSQNPKLRRRTPPGVRRGHPAGRPGPTRRLLSALRGVLLPFAHGFDDSDQDPLKCMSSKVGQCRARFAC